MNPTLIDLFTTHKTEWARRARARCTDSRHDPKRPDNCPTCSPEVVMNGVLLVLDRIREIDPAFNQYANGADSGVGKAGAA